MTVALESGQHALARLFSGSSHPRVAQAQDQLSLAGRRLREAAQEITMAAQAVGVYGAALTGRSGAAGPSDAGTAGQRTVSGRRTVRPRNPLDYERQDQWARSAYDNIRAQPDGDVIAGHLRDVPRIDGSVGFTPQDIDRIRQHIFVEVHPLKDFDDTVRKTSFSWSTRRLRHSSTTIIRVQRTTEAHAAANLVANWQNQIPAPTGEDFEAPWR